MNPRSERWYVRAGLLALGASVLVLIVAYASNGLPGATARRDSFGLRDLSSAMAPIVATFTALILALMIRDLFGHEAEARRLFRRRSSPVLTLIVLFGVVAFLWWIRPFLAGIGEAADTTTSLVERVGSPSVPRPLDVQQDLANPWWLWVFVAAAAIGVVAIAVNGRRTEDGHVPVPRPGESIRTTTDPWESYPGDDARGRVLAAYRRLEGEATTGGRPRESSVTARRHLRDLAGHSRVASSHDLSDLYEVARYADDVIPESAAETADRLAEVLREGLDL